MEKDIRITYKKDKRLEIYNFNKQEITYTTLFDSIETYYKNQSIHIRDIIYECQPNSTERELFNIIQNEKSDINPFEAQIIIPYRANGKNVFRKEQLHLFIKHMQNYMLSEHPEIKYKFVIVEQNNEHPFNRGILLNAGFMEREKDINEYIKYYIHHNCDLFPKLNFQPKLDYSYTPINEVRDLYGYSGGIGGIAIFNRLTYLKVNGFPNDYFYWGAEDTTLYKRCQNNKIEIMRPTYNIGINEENHYRDGSHNNVNLRKSSNDNPTTNGITNCKYTCIHNQDSEFNEHGDNIIHYLVDFEYTVF